MARNISIKDLRPSLPKVMDLVEKRLERFVITKRGKPIGVLLSPDDYEGLLETIDIMKDRELVRRIRRAEADVRAGRTRSLDEIHRSLGLA
ncbi:MAG: type II toxin-antitoxin system Phd/YefM family antitoxin [Elusimicrobiota bacterium]